MHAEKPESKSKPAEKEEKKDDDKKGGAVAKVTFHPYRTDSTAMKAGSYQPPKSTEHWQIDDLILELQVDRSKDTLFFASDQSLAYLDGSLPADYGFGESVCQLKTSTPSSTSDNQS